MFRIITSLIMIVFLVSACSLGPENSSSYEIVYTNKEKEDLIKQKKQVVQNKPYTIALVPNLTDTAYFIAAEEGAKEAAKDLGVEVIFTGSPIGDSIHQMEVIEDLISQDNIDAIAVSANDAFKLLPILKKARDRNIKVITWGADTDPIGRDFYVSVVDPQSLGRHLMNTLASSLDERGEFAIITSSLSASNSSEWIKWIKIQQKEYYPNMRLINIVPSNDNHVSAYKATKRIMEEYPNLAGIIGVSAVATPAAAQAVMDAEKSKSVKVLGLSLPNSMRDYVNSGDIPNITLWSPQKLGYLTVALAKNLLDGEFPRDQQQIPNVGSIRVKDNIVIMGEPILFTKENIDQYDF